VRAARRAERRARLIERRGPLLVPIECSDRPIGVAAQAPTRLAGIGGAAVSPSIASSTPSRIALRFVPAEEN
jgi:hypothetical protein